MAQHASSRTDATPDQLEAEVVSARESLEASLGRLREETQPAALARRGKAAVVGFFTDEYGGIRPERVAMAAGAVVALALMGRWRRSRRLSRCHCH